MADVENQSKNGEAVSTRTPRRTAAGNKAWQTLIPHHKHSASADMDEDEDDRPAPSPTPPAAKGAARGKTTPVASAGRKPAAAAPTPAAARAAPAAATAPVPAPPALSRVFSDEEELEEASSELFPKPPEATKPAKRKGRPPKNGGAAMDEGSIGGSSLASNTSVNKKMKLEDTEDYELEDEEEEDGEYGGPPMLNRQTSRTPSFKRACSPTCTKRCCLTEDGKRVSRQTTTGVRSDQYDPPYNARAGGKRKPRAPKQPSETPSAEKKARAVYGSRKYDKESKMMSGMGGTGSAGGPPFGSSAPGARSMQAVSVGRAVSTMPPRTTQQMGGVGTMRGPGVVTIGPGGKVQTLSRGLPSPNMPMVARPRVAGGVGGGMAAGAAAGGVTRYPVAVATPQQRLPGPAELLRAENTVDDQYRQARNTFAKHVVTGSTANEFNRVIDLLTVENKRLIAAQTEDQEYVDSLHRKIRSLENNMASLQRQLAVTTKAYHGALLEVNADRGGVGVGLPAAGAAGAARQVMGGASLTRPAAPTPMVIKTEKPEESDEQPKQEEQQQGGEEEGEEAAAARTPVPSVAVKTGAPVTAASAAGRPVPRLMEQQQQGRGGAAAALMINRHQWMHDFDDEEMFDEEMEEEEMAFFGEEEEDEEDNMGLD